MHPFGNKLDAELVDQPSCVCFPESTMPFTDCVLLWSDCGCRHELTTHVLELLSELALEFSSLVMNQPSGHVEGSNPVFEEVVPDDFRMLAGNNDIDTKNCSQDRGRSRSVTGFQHNLQAKTNLWLLCHQTL